MKITQRTDPSDTFRILILGDFSGRTGSAPSVKLEEIASRRPLQVDRDNLEGMLERLDVQLTDAVITSDERAVTLKFRELDDFHPDNLFENVATFDSLRRLRQRLINDATFDEAAEEVLGWRSAPEDVHDAEQPSRPPPPEASDESSDAKVEGLLDQMLDGALAEDQTGGGSTGVDWRRLIDQIVTPHVVPSGGPQQTQLVSCVDTATQTLMTALLRNPRFSQLESAWRGLDLLVRRLETDASLKIFLVDLTRQELAADLEGQHDITATGLYRLLVDQTVGTPGGQPWTVVSGLYTFTSSREDASLLARIATVAAAAGAPFVAAADRRVVGCCSAAEMPDPDDWDTPSADDWRQLQDLSEASYLGLVWPRFLLRLPYGAATCPVETFPFEEMTGGYQAGRCLWGNPALLVACLLGQSFTQSGWGLRPGEIDQIVGLPFLVSPEDGQPVARPCGELLLSERGVQKIVSRGLIPLLSIAGRDAVRIGSFQSLGGGPLSGPWG